MWICSSCSISEIFDFAFKYTAPVTLFLFIAKYFIDKNDEKKKKKKEHWNNFHYFETVVNMIMPQSNVQLENYDKYIVKLINEPTNTQQLTTVINENLRRLVKDFDQEKYFHSFSKQFEEKHQKRAKECFLNIYNRFDLYLKIYDNAININSNLLSSMIEWDKEHRIVFTQKVKPEIREVLNTLSAVNTTLHEKFSKLIIAFDNSGQKNSDFQILFVEPLLSDRDFYSSVIFNKLINDCSELKALYTTMKQASLFNAEQIKSLKNTLSKHLNQINELREEYQQLINKEKVKVLEIQK